MTRHAPARLGAAGLALAAAFGLGTLGVPPAPVAVAANQNVRIVDGPTPNYYGYDPDPTNPAAKNMELSSWQLTTP